jgi:beta-mannosidase
MKTSSLRQDLGGAWEFRAEAASPAGRDWLPARVPGDVHADLMACGRLADPHRDANAAAAAWVQEVDWTYRRRFEVDAALHGSRRVRLVAEGLDTWCELFLNGRRLGRAENMFAEHSWDLSGRLRSGVNTLELRFRAPGPVLRRLERRHGPAAAVFDSLRVHGRKAQYGFGWDWGPRLPSLGIFRPIYLEGDAGLRVDDLWVRTLQASAASAEGLLLAEIDSERAQTVPLRAVLGDWSVERHWRLNAGRNVVRVPWRLKRPRLWWPRGHGEAALYRAELSLGALASASAVVGLRTVTLDTGSEKDGRRFAFRVNGRPVYAKGANWIPADSFPGRVTAARLEALLGDAAAANYTMVRVWGGGLYEDEAFYQACDRLGLLVWQDFPFSCGEYPEDPAFLRLVAWEAERALRRLRRHPSLALWCGGNENHMGRHDGWFRGRERRDWGWRIYHRLLPALCRRLDPDRPYWPGSPWGGTDPNSQAEGDRHHWLVWARLREPEAYRADRGRFISEFGFASLPGRETLRRFAPAKKRRLGSAEMLEHDKVESGGAYARLAYYLSGRLPLAGGLDRFRHASQVLQAQVLRLGIEHWRRGSRTRGALVWQHNDCWPALSWSVVDASGRPKLAWYALRAAFDDVLLSAVEVEGRAEAWLSLDGAAPFEGRLRVERWGMVGREAVLAQLAVRAPANRSRRLWSRSRADCGIRDPARQYLVMHLEGKGGRLRRTQLYFAWPAQMDLRPAGLTLRTRSEGAAVAVTVRARCLALGVELHAPVPGRFSDNGFDLLPGETRHLRFTPERTEVGRGGWQALCLNQNMGEAWCL